MAQAPIMPNNDEMDLTPMIDLVFLLIIFFILAGKVSSQSRTEQITVPPTTTATKIDNPTRVIINVFGTTKSGDPPAGTIMIGTEKLRSKGVDDYSHYQRLRQILDKQYDLAHKIPDVNNPVLMIPDEMIIEIRADGDTEYRMVQEVLQVVTDSINPKDMTPRNVAPKDMKPFININYTTRIPGEKN